MKEKFTPGPWHDDRCGHVYVDITYDNGDVRKMHVATASNIDARLIAAAPDMYEALKAVLEDVQCMVDEGYIGDVMDDITYVKARAALAKADGNP